MQEEIAKKAFVSVVIAFELVAVNVPYYEEKTFHW